MFIPSGNNTTHFGVLMLHKMFLQSECIDALQTFEYNKLWGYKFIRPITLRATPMIYYI